MKSPKVSISNLTKLYTMGKNKKMVAVNNVSFSIYKGEIFGLVGESGSGKTTLAKCLMNIEKPTSGKISINGVDIGRDKNNLILTNKTPNQCQMIFQNPQTSVNPRMTIHEIISEPLIVNKRYLEGINISEKVNALMTMVGLKPTLRQRYPSEFSLGQLQRVCIARAMALDPEFIVADEPISSLDVSIQAQIVNLFKRLQKEKMLTCLFIAHDLSMVRHISDRIGVMYRGYLVEIASAAELFKNPIHWYTKFLLQSIPIPDPKNKLIYAGRPNKNIDENTQGNLVEVSSNHFVLKNDVSKF